jgi:hypothetical protein
MWKTTVILIALVALQVATPAEAWHECRRSGKECKAAKSANAYRATPQRREQDDSCRGRNDTICAARDPLGTLRDLAGRPINPDGIRR